MHEQPIPTCAEGARSVPGSKPARAVGAILQRVRARRGRKQYTVAEEAGLTKAMLSGYEAGRRLPSLGSLLRLAVALKLDLGDLQPAMEASAAAMPERGRKGV